MSGIVSAISFCISDQTDPMNSSEVSPGRSGDPCFTITTRTYEGWANFTPKDDETVTETHSEEGPWQK